MAWLRVVLFALALAGGLAGSGLLTESPAFAKSDEDKKP